MVADTEREQHGEADASPDQEVRDRTGSQEGPVGGGCGLAVRLLFAVLQCGVVDQSAWAADVRHHPVAGVDAQRAGDAADLRTFADVDPCGTDGDALQAVDAVAELAGVPLGLLDAAARFAAPVLVGDQQRLLVHHRGLDAGPGAHVDAHLFAHEPAEREGGEREDGDGDVGRGCRLARPEVAHQRRRIGEVHDPCATGPEADDEVDRILERPLGELSGA